MAPKLALRDYRAVIAAGMGSVLVIPAMPSTLAFAVPSLGEKARQRTRHV